MRSLPRRQGRRGSQNSRLIQNMENDHHPHGGHPQQANFVGVAAINKAKKHIDIIMLPDDTKIEGRKEKGIQEASR